MIGRGLRFLALVAAVGVVVGCRSRGETMNVTGCSRLRPEVQAGGGWMPASDASQSPMDGGASDQLASIIPLIAPVSTDANVRGTLARPKHVTIQKVFVANVPATDDGDDFATFDATIPFGVLVNLAAGNGTPTVAPIEITAITNCGSQPILVGVGTVNLLLAPKQITGLQLVTPSYDGGYVPTTVSYPVQIDVLANPSAAGASVMLSTTMGTINGSQSATVLLSGNGLTAASATVFLAPDPMKQGTAYVTAQAPNAPTDGSVGLEAGVTTVTKGINMFGPPLLFPAMVTLPIGQKTQIGIIDRGILSGCNAAPVAGLSITLNGSDLTSHIVDPNQRDGGPTDALPAIVIAADGGAGSSSTITCFDRYQQVGSATVNVPK
jgi:hypothetical protein